ncbi:MAG: TolC family protein [Gemmatimonadota bacterium]|nr:TolC family protein [Gemmatimonadota bacterium]MDH5197180.1 TolC family protein [Gemmatimonadota bacterium]
MSARRWTATRVAVLLLAGGAPAASAQVPDRVTMADAIAEALDRNTAVRQARASVQVADGQVREAWATVLPDINATASYQRNFLVQENFLPAFIFDPGAPPDSLIGVKFGAENNWFAGFTVSQPLFQVDAFIGVGAAGRYRALERERARGAIQQVVTEVRRRYFEVLAALELVRLNQSSVTRVRATLAETQARYRAGLTSEYDVLRFEVQLANLEPQLRRAQDAVRSTTRTLLIAMGRDTDGAVEVVGSLAEMNVVNLDENSPDNAALIALSGPSLRYADLDSVFATALAERTDVRQAELGISVEQARLKAERAQLFPKVSLFGAYNFAAQDAGSPNFFGENTTQSSWAGLRIELPIFRGFRESARMQQARAYIDQNRASLELAREQLVNELRTLVDAIAETQARVVSQNRAVAQAQRGFEIASAEYREGLGSQLQITDAELALQESEYNYAQAVFEHLIARSNLDAALGTVPDDVDVVGELARR